jgi:hypothetical protein
MLQHDFDQLPVMHGEREVKGVITWKSIAAKKTLDCKCETVADCREDPRIVDSNSRRYSMQFLQLLSTVMFWSVTNEIGKSLVLSLPAI